MPKSREKTRANKKKEKMLDKQNSFGKNDPTPYEAVKKIINKGKEAK